MRLVLSLGPNSEVIVTRCVDHFSVYQSRSLLGICSHHILTFVNLFCGHSYTCINEGLLSALLCTHLQVVAGYLKSLELLSYLPQANGVRKFHLLSFLANTCSYLFFILEILVCLKSHVTVLTCLPLC